MSDIEQRITVILNDHGLHLYGVDTPFLAHVLVSELGLTQEWTWSWEIPKGSERKFGCIVDTREEAIEEGDSYMQPAHRYVTEWVPV